LIRRGLLTFLVGVPLAALLVVLTLVFRGVILAPETARPGGTYTEGVVGQLGTLNPLFGGAAAGSNDLDALLFERRKDRACLAETASSAGRCGRNDSASPATPTTKGR